MQIMLCCKAVRFKILIHQEQSLTGSDKRLGRVEPGARITPGEKHFVGTDKTLSGPNFGNMGQGFRATMHEVVQEGLSYLTFIVEKSLLEFSPKNLSKERMGKWWIHQPSRIPLSCTTNTQFLWILRGLMRNWQSCKCRWYNRYVQLSI